MMVVVTKLQSPSPCVNEIPIIPEKEGYVLFRVVRTQPLAFIINTLISLICFRVLRRRAEMHEAYRMAS